MTTEDIKICVIGLGYVGLPLARLFSTKYKTIGFDMNQKRVDALMQGHDATLEVADDLLQDAIKNETGDNYTRVKTETLYNICVRNAAKIKPAMKSPYSDKELDAIINSLRY